APPPPSPLIQGSSTPSAKVVAITASTQSPPAASTSAPTAAALPDCAATMPPLDVVAGLRICWRLLNWSRMLLPLLSVVFVSLLYRACPPGILARHVLGYFARKGRRTLLQKRLDALAHVGMAAALDRHRLVDIQQFERRRRSGKSPQ